MFKFYLSAILMLMLSAQLSQAQSSDLSLISSGGGIAQTGALTLSYSLGEPCISYVNAGMHWLTEGFQQPGKINLTSIEINSPGKYSFSIYPNPVSTDLYIESIDSSPWQLVQITNILGRSLHFPSVTNDHTMILDLNHLSPGLYFLNLRDHFSNMITQSFIKI